MSFKTLYLNFKYYIEAFFCSSFSQEGEDKVLERLFSLNEGGYYVDIGAHHPIRFSNTYRFYKRGWSGINVDAMPRSMRVFDTLRPRDKNIECVVSDKEEDVTFYEFNEPALNTIEESVAREKSKIQGYFIKSSFKLQSRRLSEILEENLPVGQHINFMSVDVEGADLKVLKSNDWSKYSPSVLIVEAIGFDYENLFKSETIQYLKSKKYKIFSKLYNSVILVHETFKPQ